MPAMDGEELLDRVRALRATGRTPKEIARALGLRPAQVIPLVGDIAAEAHAGASERKLAGCWVSPGWSLGLAVEGHPGWPDVDTADAEAFGLVSVLVTRQERYGRVRLCGWLVDVYCLGVKDVIGPRVMDERRAADFHSSFFAAYQARPLEAPPGLARAPSASGATASPSSSRARTTRPTPCCRRWSVPLGAATSPSWSRHSRRRRRRSRRANC